MGLETATYVSDLNSAWPLGSDQKSTADDHIRLIKSVLQATIVGGTFTGTFTGFTGTVTGTCTWYRSGNIVLLSFPNTNSTSNATSFTMTGLPSAIQPATLTQMVTLPNTAMLDGSANQGSANNAIQAQITASSGTITFFKGAFSTGWTASGSKGFFYACTIAYLLT